MSSSPMCKTDIRVTHVITSLHADGAQQALARILSALGDRAQHMNVVSLRDDGATGELLRSHGTSVHTLGMQPGMPLMFGLWDLFRQVQQSRPDVVVTWLYHADLIGGLVAKLAGRLPVIWNVRRSGIPDTGTKRATQLVVAACCKLARRVPSRIVFCSERSRLEHTDRGYPADRAHVIPNGFDLSIFRPRADAAARVRAELKLPTTAKVVGHFGRFHPAKDHATLLAAAARMAIVDADVHFALCGRDVNEDNVELAKSIRGHALAGRCHLLGHRPDVAEWMAGMSLVVSSSRTEGFPNVLGEALACGVPCVGTDVGESRQIIGPGGDVAPPGDPWRLAASCLRLLTRPPEERQRLGELGRQHVQKHFEISHLAEEHWRIWRAAAKGQNVEKGQRSAWKPESKAA